MSCAGCTVDGKGRLNERGSAVSVLASFSDAEIRAEYARRFKRVKAAPEAARVPCTVPSGGAKPKTAAQAAKARRVRMERCLCRLCVACLSPAATFAEQTALVGRPYPSLDPLADLESAP